MVPLFIDVCFHCRIFRQFVGNVDQAIFGIGCIKSAVFLKGYIKPAECSSVTAGLNDYGFGAVIMFYENCLVQASVAVSTDDYIDLWNCLRDLLVEVCAAVCDGDDVLDALAFNFFDHLANWNQPVLVEILDFNAAQRERKAF